MSILTAIQKAYQTAVSRGWDTLYVLVDVHDTIAVSNYKDAEVQFYPEAIQALREIQQYPEVKLVLWTCCYSKDAARLIKRLAQEGVRIDGFNRTPVANTATGCFSKKPYYSIMIDDKAGFDPSEWPEVAREFARSRPESGLKP